MSKRIEAICSYINDTDKAIDVGCDQALLGEMLAKRGVHSVASDIRESIIENAQKRILDLNLEKYIDFLVSDGLKNVTKKKLDTLVLSGMGTYTILNIVSSTNIKFNKIITISNNNHDILRLKMNDLNYTVDKEEIIYEKGKYYNLILFVPGNTKYTKEELLIGLNHQNNGLLKEKLEIDLNKYVSIYKKSNDKKILDKINIIKEALKN